jgi:hypothetical protein
MFNTPDVLAERKRSVDYRRNMDNPAGEEGSLKETGIAG